MMLACSCSRPAPHTRPGTKYTLSGDFQMIDSIGIEFKTFSEIVGEFTSRMDTHVCMTEEGKRANNYGE